MDDTKRVVYDCNTFLQVLASPDGPAGVCVQLAFDRVLSLYVCDAVLNELCDVAGRPKVARKMRLDPDRTAAFLATIRAHAMVIEGFPQPFVYPRDPDDALYVNLALAAEAKLIVTRDADLLDLMKTDVSEALEFRNSFPGLRILTPVELLYELRVSKDEFS